MTHHELRDPGEARLFVLQGLWLQRLLPPTRTTVRRILEWALEIASTGDPLPPVGFVADLGHAAFALDEGERARGDPVVVPGLPAGLARTYEDHVLGKAYADWTFARASEALRRYPAGRDRARGLAFLLNQFRERADFAGAHLNPAVLKTLLDDPPEKTLQEGWDSLQRDGLSSLLIELYESLTAAARQTAEMLTPVDLFELEHSTALQEFGQRLALRQVLQAAERLESTLPRQRPSTPSTRHAVPTRILHEDTYPVGGFASLSTRGSVESLLHSQLAFMEKDDRPDLFDIKYLRDELLYYARDENQFLRRRHTFVFGFFPDLVHTRFKDTMLPWQRGVLLLALLLVLVRRLSDWLSTEALLFEFHFITGQELPEKAKRRADDIEALAPERNVLESVLREQIANGTVQIVRSPGEHALARHCRDRAQRSMCHCLTISTREVVLAVEDTLATHLRVDGPCPTLFPGAEIAEVTEDPLETWSGILQELLRRSAI